MIWNWLPIDTAFQNCVIQFPVVSNADNSCVGKNTGKPGQEFRVPEGAIRIPVVRGARYFHCDIARISLEVGLYHYIRVNETAKFALGNSGASLHLGQAHKFTTLLVSDVNHSHIQGDQRSKLRSRCPGQPTSKHCGVLGKPVQSSIDSCVGFLLLVNKDRHFGNEIPNFSVEPLLLLNEPVYSLHEGVKAGRGLQQFVAEDP